MAGFSNEFRVGLFAIVALGAVAWGITQVDDIPDNDTGQRWHVWVQLPSIQGAYVTTPVRIAGVTVGSIEDIALDGDHVKVTLGLLGSVKLPKDSRVDLVSEGVLGDKGMIVTLGHDPELLHDGDEILAGAPAPDIAQITRQVSDIATDVKAITSDVRGITGEDSQYRAELLVTLRNIRMLSEKLNQIAGQNDDRIATIAENLLAVSQDLKTIVSSTGGDVHDEMLALAKATESLNHSLADVESITHGIQNGEGTVGKLVKDSSTIDKVNATLDKVDATVADVQGMVGSVSKLQTQVYVDASYMAGSQPTVDGLDENPVAGGSKTTLGVRFQPAEDHWYDIAFVTSPLGNISSETHYYPGTGTSYEDITIKPTYRLSFQMAHRFHDLVLRVGMKENTGGLGADYLFFRDRLQVSADLYDFAYGSWPVLDGTPNLTVNARVSPWPHLYLQGGLDNVIFDAKYGFVTGYVGAGVQFTDDDLKYILAAAPIKP